MAIAQIICSRCKLNKSSEEFYRDSSRPSGFSSKCKQCQKKYHAEWSKNSFKFKEYQAQYYIDNKSTINKRNSEYYKNNREWLLPKMNENRFLKKYGISRAEATDLLEIQQDGKCAICSTDTPGKIGWCVDHCHDTGAIRGITCAKCNSAIGFLNDDPELCRRAAEYLGG